jgi:ribosome-associated toxin RatA of RatAB toxin-antitoxin module
MAKVHREARVPHSAAQMFDLVNDVESYPQFLHWCRGARVDAANERSMDAVVDIGLGGIHKSFKTRNTLDPPHRIDVSLIEGPFRRLEGAWVFRDLPEGGCEVELSLDYEVSHGPLGVVFAAVFEEVARSQMNAFIRRADRVYG